MTLPIPAPRAQGFTTTTPVPLYWREDGPADAPSVVLLHGGPGAHHDYMYPQMLALATIFRVITYDQRGGGQSKYDNQGPITWQTQVGDLAHILNEFALQTPMIVGYSWGGLLAMLYAIEQQRDPSLPALSKLALVSPAPITKVWRTEFETTLAERQKSPAIASLREQLNASGLRERDMAQYRQRAFELSVAGYFADPNNAEALTPFRVTGKVQQSIWESLGDFDLRDELRGVRLPVLVVHGRNDPIPLDSARAVADTLKGELVVLDQCGHVPYVEQPEQLNDVLSRFLT